MGASWSLPFELTKDVGFIVLVAAITAVAGILGVRMLTVRPSKGANVSGALLLRSDVNAITPSDSTVLHPINWRHLKIQAITKVSSNVKLFRIELPKVTDTIDLPIGRHVSVLAETSHGKVIRPYTPVSPPWAVGYVELLIKRYDGGLMSTHMFGLHQGDTISMRGPVGNLRWVPSALSRVLLIAGGTGITPMLQLMRCITESRSEGGDATAADLLFQNRSTADILLRGHIDACVSSRPDAFSVQVRESGDVLSIQPALTLFFTLHATYPRLPPAVLPVQPARWLGSR